MTQLKKTLIFVRVFVLMNVIIKRAKLNIGNLRIYKTKIRTGNCDIL